MGSDDEGWLVGVLVGTCMEKYCEEVVVISFAEINAAVNTDEFDNWLRILTNLDEESWNAIFDFELKMYAAATE